jgi:outer membrane protein assembly factor BamB
MNLLNYMGKTRRDALTGMIVGGASLSGCLRFSQNPESRNSSKPSFPQFQYDGKNSGYFRGNVGLSNGSIRWESDLGNSVGYSPITDGGTVLAVTDDRALYAVDIESGDRLWMFEGKKPSDESVTMPPSLAQGIVIAQDNYGIVGLNVLDGSEEWRFTTDRERIFSSAILDDISYVLSSNSGNFVLRAIDATNGDIQWEQRFSNDDIVSYDIPFGYPTGLTVSNSQVLVLIPYHGIKTFDSESGSELWDYELVRYGANSGTLIKPTLGKSKIFTPQYSAPGSKVKILHKGGRSEGSVPLSAPATGSIAFRDNEYTPTKYIPTMERLKSVGKETWAIEIANDEPAIHPTSPVIDNSSVYTVTTKGDVYCLDKENGAEKWRIELNEPVDVRSSPAITEEAVLVTSSAGKIYCIGQS